MTDAVVNSRGFLKVDEEENFYNNGGDDGGNGGVDGGNGGVDGGGDGSSDSD